jgi:uncharacterized repeat protein (TIGR01451 family)
MRNRFLPTLPIAHLALLAMAAALMLPVGAAAKPSVMLKLSGVLVTKDAKGAEKTTPVTDVQVKSGETIRYVITATNKGDQSALKLTPVGKIPVGTAYEAGSASSAYASRIEYSLDGGKVWSIKPTVTVHTPKGDLVKPADPATYTNLRWIADKPLVPNGAVNYSYAVRVK